MEGIRLEYGGWDTGRLGSGYAELQRGFQRFADKLLHDHAGLGRAGCTEYSDLVHLCWARACATPPLAC